MIGAIRVGIRDEHVVHDEHIDALEAEPLQALREARAEQLRHPGGRRGADATLGRDAHASREPPAERLADHALGLAVAVARRDVEQVDAELDRLARGGDGLLAGRRAPDLADPPAAEGERADVVSEAAEGTLFHGASVLRVLAARQDGRVEAAGG